MCKHCSKILYCLKEWETRISFSLFFFISHLASYSNSMKIVDINLGYDSKMMDCMYVTFVLKLINNRSSHIQKCNLAPTSRVFQIALRGGGGISPSLGRGTRNFAEGDFFVLGGRGESGICTRNFFHLLRLL